MTTTPYSRVLTNSWTISTTNAGIVTNTFIDSFSGTHECAGTNGQTFTAVVTNDQQEVGRSFLDYGPDGLRRVLTNLWITVTPNAWGVGYGTNYADAGTNTVNFSCSGTLNPYIAQTDDPGGEHEFDFVGIGRTEVQSFGAFSVDWHWADGTETPLCYTGQPPAVAWGAEYDVAHLWRIAYSGSRPASTNYVSMDISERTTNASHFIWNGSRTEYNAPLLTSLRLAVPVTVESYALSNTAAMLVDSVAVTSAGVVTSAFTVARAPAIATDFGITTNATVGDVGTYTVGTDPADYYFASYSILPYPSGSGSASTNTPLPTYSAYRSVIKWQF
jgi:hypothetical protein